ncbi:hypothetical protein, partial [uncultured Reyranella sp.]|uniref:hypothetical protein n=1 Tax=uncultured Reyranella sp. TaxID=735512 RepID=UPI00259C7E67
MSNKGKTSVGVIGIFVRALAHRTRYSRDLPIFPRLLPVQIAGAADWPAAPPLSPRRQSMTLFPLRSLRPVSFALIPGLCLPAV